MLGFMNDPRLRQEKKGGGAQSEKNRACLGGHSSQKGLGSLKRAKRMRRGERCLTRKRATSSKGRETPFFRGPKTP